MGKMRKTVVLAVCALVVLLVIYSLFEEKTDDTLAVQIAEALSQMQGVGEVKVVLHYREESVETEDFFAERTEPVRTVCGALIVAEGAEEIRVRVEILHAAAKLLDLNMDQIEILY